MAGEDAVSYIFGGNTGLTYEQLKRRRAVALALASQRRGYPKTVGEGMTYLGESIGDMLAERRLDAAEKGYLAKQSATLAGLMPGAPSAAPVSAPARPGAAPTPIIPPAAPRPPSAPVRPPAAPIPPRPAPAAPPASAVGPAPSITATPVLPSGPSSEDVTSGPPPSEFAMGGILNAAPMAAPGLEPAFPGEEGGTGQAGTQPSPSGYGGQVLPSSGYLPPATAAAPPSQSPAPQATASPAPVGPMDTAEWPAGPVNAPPTSELQPTAAGPQSSITPPPAGDTPPNVLAQAQQVALQGGPAAVSRFMADAGYPKSGAWCGQFAAAVASSAGVQPPAGPAVASNWRNVGTPVDTPQVGDVAIARPGWAPRRGSGETGNVGSHVTFVNQANPAGTFQGLGGNQGSMVKPFNAADFEFRRLPGDVQGHRIVGIPGEEPSDAQGAIQQALGNSGNVRLASYAPDGGAGAPIPGMGGAGSPRLQPQIPLLQGPPPAPESEQITPTDIMPMPATAQFGPPVGRFTRTDAPVPGVAAAPPQAPAVAPPPPQGPPGIPGPLAQPTPVTPAPSLGRQTVPVPPEFNRPLVRPTPPTYPEQPSEYEIRAQRAIAANPGDPAIHEQAKALADFGKAQRDAAYMRQVEEYKKDLELYNSLSTSREQFIRGTPERELTLRKGEEELAAKAREEERSRRLGGVDPAVLTKQIEESQKNVKNIPAATLAIANAKQVLLDQNMFTGSSAEMNLSMAKLVKAAGFPGDPRIEATEQFKSYISSIVAQARQAMAGGTNISDRDMMAAERAAAGDIKLERGSIKSVLDSVERINTAMAVDHQKKLLAFTGNDPDAQRVIFGTFGLPMENIVPPAAVQRLRDNASNPQAIREFDDAFKTPGLAQRVLGRR